MLHDALHFDVCGVVQVPIDPDSGTPQDTCSDLRKLLFELDSSFLHIHSSVASSFSALVASGFSTLVARGGGGDMDYSVFRDFINTRNEEYSSLTHGCEYICLNELSG